MTESGTPVRVIEETSLPVSGAPTRSGSPQRAFCVSATAASKSNSAAKTAAT
jgi:hypothetical protein